MTAKRYVCRACSPGKTVAPIVTADGKSIRLHCPECGAHTLVVVGETKEE